MTATEAPTQDSKMTVAELLGPAKVARIRLLARVEMARRAAKRKDIMEWGRWLFPQKFSLPFCHELHNYMLSIRGEEFTATEAPRGSAKTTFRCFLTLIFQALEEPETFKHYLSVQATEPKALAINRAIKHELETNEAVIMLYGDTMGERWTDGQFVLKNGVIFSCLGTGQSIRGLNYNNIRPDYVVVDDLYDRKDINNTESTREKTEWFWSDLFPALAQHGKTCMHVQGTAINKSDLLFELKGRKGVHYRSFKTVIDHAKKKVLWSEQKSYEDVMKQAAQIPLVIWEREFQNIRRDDASSIIKEAWLSDWEFKPVWLRDQLRKGRDPERIKNGDHRLVLVDVRIGNDPSIGKQKDSNGKKKKSDFTGTTLTIVTEWSDAPGQHDYWLMDVREEKLTMDGRCEQLKEIVDAQPADLPVRGARIEAISGFDDYASTAQKRLSIPVERIAHVDDKMTNLENKSIHFQKQRVHLNADLPSGIKQKVKDQLINNNPPHDDVRDSILLTLDGGVTKEPRIWVID